MFMKNIISNLVPGRSWCCRWSFLRCRSWKVCTLRKQFSWSSANILSVSTILFHEHPAFRIVTPPRMGNLTPNQNNFLTASQITALTPPIPPPRLSLLLAQSVPLTPQMLRPLSAILALVLISVRDSSSSLLDVVLTSFQLCLLLLNALFQCYPLTFSTIKSVPVSPSSPHGTMVEPTSSLEPPWRPLTSSVSQLTFLLTKALRRVISVHVLSS
jgi:hypothetical protein